VNGPIFHLGGGVLVTVEVEAPDIHEHELDRRKTRHLFICFCGKSVMGRCDACGYMPPADRRHLSARREARAALARKRLAKTNAKPPQRRRRRRGLRCSELRHDEGPHDAVGQAPRLREVFRRMTLAPSVWPEDVS
jgi:hypothetical protein